MGLGIFRPPFGFEICACGAGPQVVPLPKKPMYNRVKRKYSSSVYRDFSKSANDKEERFKPISIFIFFFTFITYTVPSVYLRSALLWENM